MSNPPEGFETIEAGGCAPPILASRLPDEGAQEAAAEALARCIGVEDVFLYGSGGSICEEAMKIVNAYLSALPGQFNPLDHEQTK